MTLTKSSVIISILFGSQASLLMICVFVMSRSDHDMKLLALGGVISQVSSLMATASTLLVGHDFTRRTPADLPPGAVQEDTTKTQVPPFVDGKPA